MYSLPVDVINVILKFLSGRTQLAVIHLCRQLYSSRRGLRLSGLSISQCHLSSVAAQAPYLLEKLFYKISSSKEVPQGDFLHVRKLLISTRLPESMIHLQEVMITPTSIKELDALLGVPKVTLVGGLEITDVKPLRNAREVCLVGCPKIRDVSALAKVGVLTISRCPVKFTEAMYNDDLRLSHFPLEEVSYFSQVKRLFLCNHRYLPSCGYASLRSTTDLTIIRSSLSKIPYLPSLCKIRLKSCYALEDISTLAVVDGLQSVKIDCCYYLKEISALEQVPDVQISFCPYIRLTEKLSHLKVKGGYQI